MAAIGVFPGQRRDGSSRRSGIVGDGAIVVDGYPHDARTAMI